MIATREPEVHNGTRELAGIGVVQEAVTQPIIAIT
jgi:hypothetical protein